ncbi:MAG: hypothetical protein RSE50_12705 [Myroides sp.]
MKKEFSNDLQEKRWACVSNKYNETRALYYSRGLGRHRVYRSKYPIPDYKTFKLFTFKNIKNAQKLCDEINEVYSDDFEPYEINSVDKQEKQ